MSTPDISQLTASQQEALQTYTSVTDQDPIAAIPVLQRVDWNVPIAIARFFDGEPTTDPVAEAQAALPSTSSRQTTNLQYESLLAATRPQSLSRSAEDRVERIDSSAAAVAEYTPSFLVATILTPLRIIYRFLNAVLSPFSFLVPTFLSRLFTRLLTQQARPARRALPPTENTQRFIRHFNEEYGQNHLTFSESGFNLTLDNAKKDLKFLLVVLLSPNHDDNDAWVREALLSSVMKSFLDSHKDEMVLWAGNVQDAESYQVSTSLQCTKFPFVALICNTSDTSSPGMSVIVRAAGLMSASELVTKLGAGVNAQQAQLRAARAQQTEQQASRNLRQEQDSAYERSLAQDRERARRRKEESEAQAQAEKQAQAQAEASRLQHDKAEQWKRWRAQSLPAEPAVEVKDAVRISIRMPAGQRVIRRFTAESDLEELYAFVACYEVLQTATEQNVSEPSNYEHHYGFRLVSPMPRIVFDLESGGSIKDRIGRGGNLIVEPVGSNGEGSGEE